MRGGQKQRKQTGNKKFRPELESNVTQVALMAHAACRNYAHVHLVIKTGKAETPVGNAGVHHISMSSKSERLL